MKHFLALLLGCMLLFCIPIFAEDQALTETGYPGIWIETEGYGTLTISADGFARMEY